MKTIHFGALAVPALLVPLILQAQHPDSPHAADSYEVQCEVWSATDPDLVAALEVAGAEVALEDLRAAAAGAERLLRVLSPIDRGKHARFESQSEKPTVSITTTGAGVVQEHFAGYTSSGTSATLSCNPGPSAESVTTSLSLQVSGFTEDGEDDKPSIPPARRTVEVMCDASAAPGELRMLQFQTSDPGTLVVFVRASAN